METINHDFEQETIWLRNVYHELDTQLTQVLESLEKYRAEMLNIRRTLQEEGLHSGSSKRMLDAAQQITQLEHSGGHFGLQRRLLKQLRASDKAPYFGRIDFHEHGLPTREKLYIGVRSIIEQKTGWPLVYDWRAPVSSMFYDYGLGKAEYEGPGGVYKGEIFRKRQYRIENRELVYMFENELKIDDQILQEVLARQTSQQMRNIVNTIQREQNRAIRNDQAELLLVEGPAGSGKTSVALHRIAYLLYRQRSFLRSEHVLIFSPSKIFSDYISHVLPELGEENVPTLTFKDYAERFFRWEWEVESQFACLERIFKKQGRERQTELETIAFKSSKIFQDILDRLVRLIEAEASAFFDITIMGRNVLTQREQARLFNKDYEYLPISGRLNRIYRRFLFILRPIKKNLIKETLKEVQALQAFAEESWVTAAREAIRRVREQLDPVMELVRAHLQVDPFDWYRRLWEDEQLWQKVAADFPRLQGGRDELVVMDEGQILFSDAPALLYLQGELEGYLRSENYRQIIVDEVQDYGPLQLAVLTRAFPKAKFTFVGDAFQSLSPFFWENSVGKLEDAFTNIEPQVVALTKSYRSTVEIFQFCNAVLGEKPQAENVLRRGRKPILAHTTKAHAIEGLKEHILALKERNETVAIICLTLKECEALYANLSPLLSGTEISLLSDETASFQPGVLIMPVYLAKGLEFDAVIIPEVGESVYHEDFQRRLLYVACSRALHELRLLYTDTPSPLLSAVSQGLYQLEGDD